MTCSKPVEKHSGIATLKGRADFQRHPRAGGLTQPSGREDGADAPGSELPAGHRVVFPPQRPIHSGAGTKRRAVGRRRGRVGAVMESLVQGGHVGRVGVGWGGPSCREITRGRRETRAPLSARPSEPQLPPPARECPPLAACGAPDKAAWAQTVISGRGRGWGHGNHPALAAGCLPRVRGDLGGRGACPRWASVSSAGRQGASWRSLLGRQEYVAREDWKRRAGGHVGVSTGRREGTWGWARENAQIYGNRHVKV